MFYPALRLLLFFVTPIFLRFFFFSFFLFFFGGGRAILHAARIRCPALWCGAAPRRACRPPPFCEPRAARAALPRSHPPRLSARRLSLPFGCGFGLCAVGVWNPPLRRVRASHGCSLEGGRELSPRLSLALRRAAASGRTPLPPRPRSRAFSRLCAPLSCCPRQAALAVRAARAFAGRRGRAGAAAPRSCGAVRVHPLRAASLRFSPAPGVPAKRALPSSSPAAWRARLGRGRAPLDLRSAPRRRCSFTLRSISPSPRACGLPSRPCYSSAASPPPAPGVLAFPSAACFPAPPWASPSSCCPLPCLPPSAPPRAPCAGPSRVVPWPRRWRVRALAALWWRPDAAAVRRPRSPPAACPPSALRPRRGAPGFPAAPQRRAPPLVGRWRAPPPAGGAAGARVAPCCCAPRSVGVVPPSLRALSACPAVLVRGAPPCPAARHRRRRPPLFRLPLLFDAPPWRRRPRASPRCARACCPRRRLPSAPLLRPAWPAPLARAACRSHPPSGWRGLVPSRAVSSPAASPSRAGSLCCALPACPIVNLARSAAGAPPCSRCAAFLCPRRAFSARSRAPGRPLGGLRRAPASPVGATRGDRLSARRPPSLVSRSRPPSPAGVSALPAFSGSCRRPGLVCFGGWGRGVGGPLPLGALFGPSLPRFAGAAVLPRRPSARRSRPLPSRPPPRSPAPAPAAAAARRARRSPRSAARSRSRLVRSPAGGPCSRAFRSPRRRSAPALVGSSAPSRAPFSACAALPPPPAGPLPSGGALCRRSRCALPGLPLGGLAGPFPFAGPLCRAPPVLPPAAPARRASRGPPLAPCDAFPPALRPAPAPIVGEPASSLRGQRPRLASGALLAAPPSCSC